MKCDPRVGNRFAAIGDLARGGEEWFVDRVDRFGAAAPAEGDGRHRDENMNASIDRPTK
jgi:hypothetical protein